VFVLGAFLQPGKKERKEGMGLFGFLNSKKIHMISFSCIGR
jgi:hypothetical protein